MALCARCLKRVGYGPAPRINGQLYCSRECYEAAMRDKKLTR
jgi:hypothetical protein